jgi:ureidoglycolate lyase
MGLEYNVASEELTIDGFAPYGQAILLPEDPAPKQGEDWDCWFPLGTVSEGRTAVGIVTTRPTDGLITAMEREPKMEFLLPTSGAVIQAVALPGDLSDHTQQPDATTVKAFIIKPGQVIIMGPGTWHWAALPLKEETLYYFATEPHPPEPGREASPWVPFLNGDTVRILIPG